MAVAFGLLLTFALCLCLCTVECSENNSSAFVEDHASIPVGDKHNFTIEPTGEADYGNLMRAMVVIASFDDGGSELFYPKMLDEMDARSAQLRAALKGSELTHLQKRGLACVYGRFAEEIGTTIKALAMNHGLARAATSGVKDGAQVVDSKIQQMWFDGYKDLEDNEKLVSRYAAHLKVVAANFLEMIPFIMSQADDRSHV